MTLALTPRGVQARAGKARTLLLFCCCQLFFSLGFTHQAAAQLTACQKLKASDGTAGDMLGFSVSLGVDQAMVGAYYDDQRGPAAGSAYVYVRSGTSWAQQQKLTASDGVQDDYFGHGVAIGKGLAVAGAYGDDDRGASSGSVYVFARSGTIWAQQQKLTAGDGAPLDYFGQDISLQGQTLLVGVYRDDDKGKDSGSAISFSGACSNVAGSPCISASSCSSGHCVDGVCCDSACGKSATDCQGCSVKVGAAQDGKCGPLQANTSCRPATGACDVAEVCDGKTGACPADALRPSVHTCRQVAGNCDAAEACTGSSKDCPKDSFKPYTTICRAAADTCDKDEYCSGFSADCPKDAHRYNFFVCRQAAGECDKDELCTGNSVTCPVDTFKPNGTSCLGGAGSCAAGKCQLNPDGGILDQGVDSSGDAGLDAAPDAAPDITLDKALNDATDAAPDLALDVAPPPDLALDAPHADAAAPDSRPDAVSGREASAPPDRGQDQWIAREAGPADSVCSVGVEGSSPPAEEGCSCGLTGEPDQAPPLWLLMLLYLAASRRKRSPR